MSGNQSLVNKRTIVSDADSKNVNITTLEQAKQFTNPRCEEIREAKMNKNKFHIEGKDVTISVDGATYVTPSMMQVILL